MASKVPTEDSNIKVDNSDTVLSSIITQTDRFGNPISHAPPSGAQGSADVDDIALEEDVYENAPRTYVKRFLCCLFVYNKNNSKHGHSKGKARHDSINLRANAKVANPALSNTSINIHSINMKNRPVHYPLPIKLPNMGDISHHNIGKKCLALDLDETLVHSSFDIKDRGKADIILPVNIDGKVFDVYVIKRPGVDQFLQRLSKHYELVIYTASLSKYADPLLDRLDIHKVLGKRLFRENCVFYEGHYVKDLYLLNRDLKHTIIVDNSPMSYKFHPSHAIDCTSFIDDPTDTEMWQIADFLISIADCEDVSHKCNSWREWVRNQNINYSNFSSSI